MKTYRELLYSSTDEILEAYKRSGIDVTGCDEKEKSQLAIMAVLALRVAELEKKLSESSNGC